MAQYACVEFTFYAILLIILHYMICSDDTDWYACVNTTFYAEVVGPLPRKKLKEGNCEEKEAVQEKKKT